MGGLMSRLNLAGMRYGRLLVCGFDSMRGNHSVWECLCDCGERVKVRLNNLRTGHTKSCGCLLVASGVAVGKANLRHGHMAGGHRTPTYQSWRCMRERCLYPSNASYKNYGAKGIRFVSDWESFGQFLADMGERPTEMTLDRLDPTKDYSKSNCRWATAKEQNARGHHRGRKI